MEIIRKNSRIRIGLPAIHADACNITTQRNRQFQRTFQFRKYMPAASRNSIFKGRKRPQESVFA